MPLDQVWPENDAGSFLCCGVRIDALTLDTAADEVLRRAEAGVGTSVHLCNAYTLSLAHRLTPLRQTLNQDDLNLADGMPLVWVGRRLGFTAMTGRVYGPDLMRAVVDRGRSRALRHYLYGSTPPVVDRLAASLRSTYPGAEIVGMESPSFRPLRRQEGDALVERVRGAAAAIVWVGLGTPKQDWFVHDFAARLGIPTVAVGAAFDFLAGTTPQAPRILQDHGLEWAYRLVREPRRLWRRYLIGNLTFLEGLARRDLTVLAPPQLT